MNLSRHSLLRRFTALALLTLLGCGDATMPFPAGAVAMTPRPGYALWWSLTERCSGLTGDMNAIHWYSVPGYTFLDDARANGIYYTDTHRIVLAGAVVDTGPVVRHEMLHALIGTPSHPAAYFQDRCGGIVSCSADCISDGGGKLPVDSTGSVVSLDEMEVTATVDPAVPVQSESSWVALTVEIHNPYTRPVRVLLTPVSGTTSSETFGYNVLNCSSSNFRLPTYDWVARTTVVLGASSSMRKMFDIGDWRRCQVLFPFFNVKYVHNMRIQPTPPASHSAGDS